MADNAGYLEVGLNFLRRIERRCRQIGDAPFAAVSREDLGSGFRVTSFERSTAIVYRVNDNAVEIVGVFYGGRDIDTLMLQRP